MLLLFEEDRHRDFQKGFLRVATKAGAIIIFPPNAEVTLYQEECFFSQREEERRVEFCWWLLILQASNYKLVTCLLH